jgi:galactokinase
MALFRPRPHRGVRQAHRLCGRALAGLRRPARLPRRGDPGRGGEVVIVDCPFGGAILVRAGRPARERERMARYALAVVRRLAANFPARNLARGSSSRATCRRRPASAVPARWSSRSPRRSSPVRESSKTAAWRDAIRTDEDRAGYFGCIENGASFGPLAGDVGVGTHGGSEDHAAIVMSRAGELRQFSYDPIRLERVAMMPAGWTFVVAFSGVHAAQGRRAPGGIQPARARLPGHRGRLARRHPGDDARRARP